MSIIHIEAHDYTENDDRIDWFEVDGETVGLSKKDGEFRLIDCDGCPVEMPTAEDLEVIEALSDLSETF